MSPTTSAATMSYEYDVQSEKLASRSRKRFLNSSCPCADFHAPRTVTGSFLDQIASLGAASPLCSASSASLRWDFAHSRNCSLSFNVHLPCGGSFGPRITKDYAQLPGIRAETRAFCPTLGAKLASGLGRMPAWLC